jgi:hypothetical protein
MAALIDNIRIAMPGPRGRPVCFACGRGISPRDEQVRVRGGSLVHRSCGTYRRRGSTR